MKKLVLLVHFILFCGVIQSFSQNWTNPSKEWITVDSLAIYRNQDFAYRGLACSDSINYIALASNFNGTWLKSSIDSGLTWQTIMIDTMRRVVIKPKDTIQYYPNPARCINSPTKEMILLGCDSGIIKKSIDRGITWKDIRLDSNSLIISIKMINSNIGVAASPDKVFLTEDSGNNWKKLNFRMKDFSTKLAGIQSLSMPDSNNIFLSVAFDTTYMDVEPISYRYFSTSDRGNNWLELPDTTQSGQIIEFIDKNTGWSHGGKYREIEKDRFCYMPRIYKTTDGGLSWSIQLEELYLENCSGIYSLKFFDSNNGIAVNNFKIYRTTDGGLNWYIEKINEGYYFNFYSGVAFASLEHPIITSDDKIFRFTPLVKKNDIEPPRPFWTKKECNGNIEDGLAIDFPKDSNYRSNMKSITLDVTQSYNYNLFVPAFTPGDTDVVRWKLRRSYQDKKAKAVLTFSDMNGNDTTISIETYPAGYDYPAKIDTTNFNLAGNADFNNKIINLTPTLNYKKGAVWYNSSIQVKHGFTCYFNFRLSGGNNNLADENSLPGGDGLAFVIQNQNNLAIGLPGGGIGFQGIPNSLAVEFDTYQNTINSDSINDPNGNHIAVFSGGKGEVKPYHNSEYQLGVSGNVPVFRCDSTMYHVMIEYNLTPNVMRVFVDTNGYFLNPSLEIHDLNISKLLALDNNLNAFVGLTASTGNAWERQDILSWSFCPYDSIISDINEEVIRLEMDNNFISPNPATDFIDLFVGAGSKPAFTSDVRVFDIFGQIVSTPNPTPALPASREGVRIDVSGFAPGMYFVRNGDKVQKFIKY